MYKKIISLLAVGLFGICCLTARVTKYYSGIPSDNHLPSCHAICCPECRKGYSKGKNDGGIAQRSMKQLGKDEEGNYIEYVCPYGHTIWFYYKNENGRNVPLHDSKENK